LVSAEGAVDVIASARGGFMYLLTLTAPSELGQHRAHWSKDWCRCTPAGGIDVAKWNAASSSHWNRLRTALSRESGRLEFFRVVEIQDGKRLGQVDPDGNPLPRAGRGALHLHIVVWSQNPLRESRIRSLAMDANFGHEVKLDRLEPGQKRGPVISYVTKYVSKSVDSRHQVPWWGQVGERVVSIDLDTGEAELEPVFGNVARARYRTWSSSQGWGYRMCDARAKARLYALDKKADEDALAERFAEMVRLADSFGEPFEPAFGPDPPF
jgi:hypothetical protein